MVKSVFFSELDINCVEMALLKLQKLKIEGTLIFSTKLKIHQNYVRMINQKIR
jgi:hypothetical protein